MKPNKYDALEFCRRTINSCKTVNQCLTAENLICNFHLMFSDVWCKHLLDNEWEHKYEKILFKTN